MPRPATAEAEIAEELAVVRPALLPAYRQALPGARAAVLTRLWRGLTHDPLPWVTGREDTRSGWCCGWRTGGGWRVRCRIRTRRTTA